MCNGFTYSTVQVQLPALANHQHIHCKLIRRLGTATTTMEANAEGRSLFWDEKMVGIKRTASVRDHYRQRSHNRMILLFAVLITALHLFVYLLFTQILDLGPLQVQDVVQTSTAHSPVRVPLEAHIMSKCPDSKDCLEYLVVPAMEKVYDKVDFKLSYIGTYVVHHAALRTWPRS